MSRGHCPFIKEFVWLLTIKIIKVITLRIADSSSNPSSDTSYSHERGHRSETVSGYFGKIHGCRSYYPKLNFSLLFHPIVFISAPPCEMPSVTGIGETWHCLKACWIWHEWDDNNYHPWIKYSCTNYTYDLSDRGQWVWLNTGFAQVWKIFWLGCCRYKKKELNLACRTENMPGEGVNSVQ